MDVTAEFSSSRSVIGLTAMEGNTKQVMRITEEP